MTEFLAPVALLPSGWKQNVRITVDADGEIVSVEAFDDYCTLPRSFIQLGGPVIPGFPNVHSHSFQRGMAGLAEWRASDCDSFWSWRETMYQFVLALDPRDLLAISEFLYTELLVHGYTSVTEFHYLHRDPNGKAYADLAELSRVILAAGESTGIGLTLLPTLYSYGGCGQQPLDDSQRRFRTSPDDILSIFDKVRADLQDTTHRVGIAAHSIRATDVTELIGLLTTVMKEDDTIPIHMHVAEQQREVDECLGWSRKRPVQWAIDNLPINENWCLIHATHIMGSELDAIGASGACVCVCPTTEANLGDGVFPAKRFVEQGGRLAIGSDSHVSVSPFEELCELEYAQRLVYQQRNMLATPDRSTGRFLCEQVWQAGLQASGRPIGELECGSRADFLVLDPAHPRLIARQGDQLLDALIFGGTPDMIESVYVAGQKQVERGKHLDHDRISRQFSESMQRVLPGFTKTSFNSD